MTRLPFLLPWVRVNLLIRSITGRSWRGDDWRVVKPQLRRALAIRTQLGRAAWWN